MKTQAEREIQPRKNNSALDSSGEWWNWINFPPLSVSWIVVTWEKLGADEAKHIGQMMSTVYVVSSCAVKLLQRERESFLLSTWSIFLFSIRYEGLYLHLNPAFFPAPYRYIKMKKYILSQDLKIHPKETFDLTGFVLCRYFTNPCLSTRGHSLWVEEKWNYGKSWQVAKR